MERRRDFRHTRSYSLSLKCRETGQRFGGLWTENVSASGLYFRPRERLVASTGANMEVQLYARPDAPNQREIISLMTDAAIVRISGGGVALQFERPLAF